MPRRCSSTIVTMTTGMSARDGSPFNAASTVQPSISGIMMSRVIAAGRSARLLQPVDPVRRGLDDEARGREMRGDQLARRRIVVDHQNGAAGAVLRRNGGLRRARRSD